MTISNENRRTSYTASGATVFAYDWRILEDADLLVITRTTAGVETTEVLTTDYTVQGAGDASGGTITFGTAPTSSDLVVIILDPALTQPLDFTAAGAFPAAAHEEGLDRATNNDKRTRDLAERSLTLTDGSTPGSGEYDADSQKIINLLDPTADQDAATLAFVNASIATAVLTPTTPVSAFGATLIDDADAPTALTTLGLGTITKSFVIRTSTAGMFSDLGVPTAGINFIQGYTSAAVARGLLEVEEQIPLRNYLVNGGFQISQHGTSAFTAATTPANNDDTYLLDQWILLSDGNDIVDVVQIAAGGDLPEGAGGGVACVVTGTGGNVKWGLFQPIESVVSFPFRNRTVTLTVWAKSTSGLTGMRMHLISYTGFSPDSITSDIVGVTWGAATVVPTPIANVEFVEPTVLAAEEFAATGTWAAYSATFVVPAAVVNLGVFIGTNDSSYATADIIAFSNVKLELGSTATPFVTKPLTEDLQECERFYVKTFDVTVNPVENLTSHEGALAAVVAGDGFSNSIATEWRFPVRMVKTPTVVTYNWSAAGTGWRDDGNSTTVAITAPVADKSKAYIGSAAATVTVGVYYLHATANARL